jgi:hypothetical protein
VKLIQGEEMILINDAPEVPLPAHFRGATITDIFSDPAEKAVSIAVSDRYVIEVGPLDGQRPAPGKPYRMGVRLGEYGPATPGPSLRLPPDPHDVKLHATLVGHRLDRMLIERSGGGIVMEIDGGRLILQVNASGIVVASDNEAPTIRTQ